MSRKEEMLKNDIGFYGNPEEKGKNDLQIKLDFS